MKNKKRIISSLCFVQLFALMLIFTSCTKNENKINYAPVDNVSVYETTGSKSKLLTRQNSIALETFAEEDFERQSIFVDSSIKYQEYEGFGASMTHASAYLLMKADEETRMKVLKELFSKDGANFSMVRLPVGSSDYVKNDVNPFFTCDDLVNGEDKNLEHFTIDRDKDIISICKEIIKLNPDVSFIASPWSAPAWMKENKSLIGGGKLDPKMNDVYAAYLVKFIEEYKEEGININKISVLNEPNIGALFYPTMDMDPEQAAHIIESLGRMIKDKGLKTKIMAWDYNYGTQSSGYADLYLETVFDKEISKANDYIDTVAFHGYDPDGYLSSNLFGLKNGIEKVSRDYKKSSLITEITEHSGGTDFAANLTYSAKHFVINPCAVQSNYDGDIWNGCTGTMYWNFVLDSKGQPTPAVHDTECFGIISLDEKRSEQGIAYKYSKSSAYYVMGHVSKFLYDVDGVGCYGINATSDYADLVFMSYYRNDGAIVVVVCNTNETNNANVDIVIDNKYKISYDFVPQSIVTFVA